MDWRRLAPPSPLAAAAAALAAAYGAASGRAPLATNMALGAVIAGVGDAACQVAVEGRSAAQVDARRVLNLSLVRAFVMAPFLHVYFPWLSRLVPGARPWQVAKRVVADQVFGPPLSLPLVFGAAALLQGRPETAWPRLREQLLPTWGTGVFYWPLVHSYNFSRVPVASQPLFAHLASVPWNMVLSFRSNVPLAQRAPGVAVDGAGDKAAAAAVVLAAAAAVPLAAASAAAVTDGVGGIGVGGGGVGSVGGVDGGAGGRGGGGGGGGAPGAGGGGGGGGGPAAAGGSLLLAAPRAAAARVPTEHRHPLLAGALTGAAEIACTYPFEFVKTQLQIAPAPGAAPFRGSADCARRTLAQHGPAGLYRGFLTNFAGALPRTAIRFSVYERCAAELRARDGAAAGAPLQPWQSFAAGLVAGVVEAALVIVPMTTLQVRLIADGGLAAPRFRGPVHGARTIWREEGPRGLYRGAAPTLLKIAINISCRFLLYNELVAILEARWREAAAAAAAGGAGAGGGGIGGVLAATGESTRFAAFSMLAGAVAGAITVVGNHPIDVVKSTLQAEGSARYASALQCLRAIAREEGARGLYKGLAPRLNRVVLETSLTFTFYEWLSRAANRLIDGRD